MAINVNYLLDKISGCTLLLYIDTFPIACWKKSQCGLEFHYGNLILLRLVEVKDYYLADPNITSITIIENGEFHKKPNSELHGIVLEVMDVYPIIKHSEHKFGLVGSKAKPKSGLVRTKPVKRKLKQEYVDQHQKSVNSGSTTMFRYQINGALDQARDQNIHITFDSILLRALDLAVVSKPPPRSKISPTANALILDKSSHFYEYNCDFIFKEAQLVTPQSNHKGTSIEKAQSITESTQR